MLRTISSPKGFVEYYLCLLIIFINIYIKSKLAIILITIVLKYIKIYFNTSIIIYKSCYKYINIIISESRIYTSELLIFIPNFFLNVLLMRVSLLSPLERCISDCPLLFIQLSYVTLYIYIWYSKYMDGTQP